MAVPELMRVLVDIEQLPWDQVWWWLCNTNRCCTWWNCRTCHLYVSWHV